MAVASISPERAAALQYGVMWIPGLAGAWPELRGNVDRIFAQRMAKLPWLPSDWLDMVRKLQAERPADLVTLAPSRRPKTDASGRVVDPNGPPAADVPLFLDGADKLDAWQRMYFDLNAARSAYAAARAAEGRAELDRLYANAAFWDASYKIAVFVRDAPANVVKGIGSGVVGFVGTFLPESLKSYAKWVTVLILLLVVGGIVAWYRKRLTALIRSLRGGGGP